MTLNIIIPAYNEEKRIDFTLNKLNEFLAVESSSLRELGIGDVICYVVNDGSSDSTLQILKDLKKNASFNLRILNYDKNMGKGFAVRYGFLNSGVADFYYLADADYAAAWNTLPQLLNTLKNTSSDIVIGSRALNPELVSTSFVKRLLGRLSNFAINLILGLNFKDTQCGYKLFTKNSLKIFEKLTIERWGFDFELLYLAKLHNLKVTEQAIEWKNVAGSKVTLTSYFTTLSQLFKVRFTKYNLR